jgi:hypothetical protein
MAKKVTAPACAHCGRPAVLVTGADVYGPHRPDLADKWLWKCTPCRAWVGCHGKTQRALGIPANYELRQARMTLHERRIDPLWQGAITSGGYMPEDAKAVAVIRGTARARVYSFLAWRLGIDRDECHSAMFDLEMCRRAWVALRGVEYPEIRSWAKARKAAKDSSQSAPSPTLTP